MTVRYCRDENMLQNGSNLVWTWNMMLEKADNCWTLNLEILQVDV